MSRHGDDKSVPDAIKAEPLGEAVPEEQDDVRVKGEPQDESPGASHRAHKKRGASSLNRSVESRLAEKEKQLKKSKSYTRLPACDQKAFLEAKLKLFAATAGSARVGDTAPHSASSASSSVGDAVSQSMRRHAADLTDDALKRRLAQRAGESLADFLDRLKETHADLDAANADLKEGIGFHELDRMEAEVVLFLRSTCSVACGYCVVAPPSPCNSLVCEASLQACQAPSRS
jgi:hypothetical protein